MERIGKLSRRPQVEQLETRCTPSANGREWGTGTVDLVKAGVNIGEICRVEKGECATEALEFLQPPGQNR